MPPGQPPDRRYRPAAVVVFGGDPLVRAVLAATTEAVKLLSFYRLDDDGTILIDVRDIFGFCGSDSALGNDARTRRDA